MRGTILLSSFYNEKLWHRELLERPVLGYALVSPRARMAAQASWLQSLSPLELVRLPLDGRDFFLMVLLVASLLVGAQVGLGETMKAS